MEHPVNVQPLEPENTCVLNAGLDMMNRTQGKGLFQMKYLTSKIERNDALVLGAFVDEVLIGVGCAEIITNFGYYKPFEVNIEKRLKNQKVGSLCSMCVREDFQGKGIGKTIAIERLKWLKEQNCKLVLGVAWLSGLHHTSDRVFEKLGFQLLGVVREFFKEAAIKFPFGCPGCNAQPCKCSAALYQYKF